MATYTVTNPSDQIVAGSLNLRQAIEAANSTPDVDDVIEFAPSIVSGTIITLTNDELNITDSLTIQGTGIIVSGNNQSRVFNIYDGTEAVRQVLIDGLTITNGHYSIGSGIYNKENTTITNCIITQSGGDLDEDSGSVGGGIYNQGILSLVNSTVSGNSAFRGGGIFNYQGTITIQNSTISGNRAIHTGGAIFNGGPRPCNMTIINSTISGNRATDTAGGIYNVGSRSTTNILNVTIAENVAASGGGLYNNNKKSSTLTLANTIIANSSGGDFVNLGSFTSTNNLVEDGSDPNAISGDPNLSPLQNNDGLTLTHALLQGSIAINRGNTQLALNNALTTDQRGQQRIIDGIVDIGAYEFSPPPPSISINDVIVDDSETNVNAVFTLTLSSASNSPITIEYATADGNAFAGQDYMTSNGVLTIAPGATTATISVPIITDNLIEFPESFVLNLANLTNATLADASGTATIINFDPAQYGASYNDLIEAFGYNLDKLRQHYYEHGIAEGRSPDRFDEFRYIASSYVSEGDLINVYVLNGEGATEHYIRYGYNEHRSLTAFDPARYIDSYDDLYNSPYIGTNTLSATKHFITNGFAEGRDPNLFPSDRYIASYGDLINTYHYNLEEASNHYLMYGRGEKRQITFDPAVYLMKNPDVAADGYYGSSLERATEHYIVHGFLDGHPPM